MGNGWLERLRGARRIEIFIALLLVALLALALTRGGGAPSGDRTDLERRVERILSRVDGAGSVSAMIAQDGEGVATGAVIVADGLNDVATYLRLQRAACALLELEPSQIEIIGPAAGFGGDI